nr:hypothetical protein [Synechococcus sp. CBW1006]
MSSSDCQRPRPILPSTTGRKLIAQRQGNQVDVGIARFIRRHTRAQVEMVVEPGALWCCQLKKETLDVSQQALLVLVEGQSSGGVLSRGDQQAVADPTAIDQSLQVRRDVMAAEGAGRLQMEAVCKCWAIGEVGRTSMTIKTTDVQTASSNVLPALSWRDFHPPEPPWLPVAAH